MCVSICGGEETSLTRHRGADDRDVDLNHGPDVNRNSVPERIFGTREDLDSVQSNDTLRRLASCFCQLLW